MLTHGLLDDLRYALRTFSKTPRFTATVTLTLGLAIALTTVVFSVLDAVFLRPLPFNGVSRIVKLDTYSAKRYQSPASYPEYRDWRRECQGFDALGGYTREKSVNFERNGQPAALRSISTTDNFFKVFGVQPLFGRTFIDGEEQPGRNDVVVLSYDVWREFFHANPDAVGSAVKVDGRQFRVIGIMPKDFAFPLGLRSAIYYPLHLTQMQEARGNHWLRTLARLRSGVSSAQAKTQMQIVLDHLGTTYPENKGRYLRLVPLEKEVLGDAEQPFMLVAIATSLLLLSGCVTVAGLLATRGVQMQRDASIRAALGAPRIAIVRQLLLEAALYGLIGGCFGLVLAFELLSLIRNLLEGALPRGGEVAVNLTVLIASLSISVFTAFGASLLPAWRLSSAASQSALRSGNRGGTDRTSRMLRTSFATTQIALAFVLLATSGLLLRMLSDLRSTDLGFEADHLIGFDIELSTGAVDKRNQLENFYNPLVERVSRLPGVRGSGLNVLMPIDTWGWNSEVQILGQPPAPTNEARLAELRIVSAGFHAMLGARLIRGRYFDAKLDKPGSQRVTVVNQAFVRRFIPAGLDPIGQAMLEDGDKITIVGVVSDTRQDLRQRPLAEFDWPTSQLPENLVKDVLPNTFLMVRTDGDPLAIAAPVRQILRQLDPAIPFRKPQTMEEVVANQLKFEQLQGWIFGSFSGLALTLALVGLFGLIDQEVQAGRRDIGVRIALGATPLRILRAVYSRVGQIVASGLVLGSLLAWSARRIIMAAMPAASVFFESTLMILAFAFAICAFLAAAAPAARAVAVDPMQSLREE